MKDTLTLSLVLLFAVSVAGQTRLRRPCPASTTPAAVELERDGDISLRPCNAGVVNVGGDISVAEVNAGSLTVSDRVRLVDPSYSSAISQTNYFTSGSGSRMPLPAANNFLAVDNNYPLTISGSNKYYVGTRTNIDLQGTVTNPTVIGQWVQIASNGTVPAGTGTVYGVNSNVDIGGVFAEAHGGYFSAVSGGNGSSGMASLVGVSGVAGMSHNGNLGTAIGGDFYLASSSSTPSVTTTAAAVRARATLNPGVTATTLRGLSISNWVMNGGAITNSVGLYIDSSIDAGSSSRYSILSESTSPAKVAHDVYISDSTKGIVLRSPNGTCYRFTVANGGALSAGAAVTCP